MVSSPITLTSAAKHSPCSLMSSGDLLTVEDKTRTWFTDADHAGTTHKSTGALQPLSGTILKDTGKGKPLWWAGLGAVHVVILFGGRNGQMYKYSLDHMIG